MTPHFVCAGTACLGAYQGWTVGDVQHYSTYCLFHPPLDLSDLLGTTSLIHICPFTECCIRQMSQAAGECWQTQNKPCYALQKQRNWASLDICLGCLQAQNGERDECRFQGKFMHSVAVCMYGSEYTQDGDVLSVLRMLRRTYVTIITVVRS